MANAVLQKENKSKAILFTCVYGKQWKIALTMIVDRWSSHKKSSTHYWMHVLLNAIGGMVNRLSAFICPNNNDNIGKGWGELWVCIWIVYKLLTKLSTCIFQFWPCLYFWTCCGNDGYSLFICSINAIASTLYKQKPSHSLSFDKYELT